MILDTNILISYLNGDPKIVEVISDWKQSGRILFVSSISKAETLALPALIPEEINKICAFLNSFLSIPFDDSIVESTAFFQKNLSIKTSRCGYCCHCFRSESSPCYSRPSISKNS